MKPAIEGQSVFRPDWTACDAKDRWEVIQSLFGEEG
jgi:hypothetical protein